MKIFNNDLQLKSNLKYNNLKNYILESLKTLKLDKNNFTVIETEDKIFSILNSKRKHNAGKHILSNQITENFKKDKIFCYYSGKQKSFIFSSKNLKS